MTFRVRKDREEALSRFSFLINGYIHPTRDGPTVIKCHTESPASRWCSALKAMGLVTIKVDNDSSKWITIELSMTESGKRVRKIVISTYRYA